MKWKKISINNFLSIKEAELELDNRGLILVEGKNLTNSAFLSNGSGKSTLMDSIVYALYDTTSKGIRADDVVNNKAKKDTSVILEGEQDGVKYRIERYRKHTKHKNTVKFFIDEKDVSEKSVRDTNKTIERIIGIDYNTFINSIMFSQGAGAGRFAIATDREKKEILENLVNLSIYAEAQEIAKEKVKQKQNEIDEAYRNEERMEWELENLTERDEEDEKNYSHTRDMMKQEMDNISVWTEQMAKYVQNEFPKVEVLRTEVDKLRETIDNQAGPDTDDISKQLNEEYAILQRKSNDLRNEERIKEEQVANYKKIQSDTHCPICGTELDNTHREKEMLSIREKVKEHLINIQRIGQELTTIQNTYDETLAKHNEFQKQRNEIHSQMNSIRNTIQEKENSIRNYESELQRQKNAIDNSQDTLSKLNKVPKPVPRDKERKDIDKKIKTNKEQILGFEKEKNILEDAVKVYSNTGVKSHVLDLITPFLNERANTYLNKLTGSDIEIVFSTQTTNKSGDVTDKFDIQVMNSTGGTTYQANSEGEKKRIDLAISLAIQDLVLSKSNMSTNFVVYDEVFDALDAIGSENVVDLLRERLNTVGSIFVITHSESLKPLFENIITVTKTSQGDSVVTEGGENK